MRTRYLFAALKNRLDPQQTVAWRWRFATPCGPTPAA
jgi:hypothetical protein